MPRHLTTAQVKKRTSELNAQPTENLKLKKLRRNEEDRDPDYRPTQAKCDRSVALPSCEDDADDEVVQLFRRSTRVARNMQKLDVETLDSSSDSTSQCELDDCLSEISDFVDLDDEMLHDLDLYQDIDCFSNKTEKDPNSANNTTRASAQDSNQKSNNARAPRIFMENFHASPKKIQKPKELEPDRMDTVVVAASPESSRRTTGRNKLKQTRRSRSSKTCPICTKKFKQLGHLRSHFLLHTGEKPFICEWCDKSFSQSGHLMSHFNSHTSFRPYICDYCSKRFTQSGHKRNHERSHLGIRPYKCDHCDKNFTQSGHLTNHLRIHVGERPYSCEVCGRSFTQSGHLSSHMKTHDNCNNNDNKY